MKRITYLALLIPIVIMGCCSTKCGCKLTEFHISWGEGGGATGRWSGYTIDSKKKELTKWSGLLQEENAKHQKKLCKSKLKTIFKEIEKNDLINIKYQEPANMSHYIKITTAGKTNIILWNPNLETEITTKLNNLYSFLNKYTK